MWRRLPLPKTIVVLGLLAAAAAKAGDVPVPPPAPRPPNLSATALPAVPDLEFGSDGKPAQPVASPAARDLRGGVPTKPRVTATPDPGGPVPIQPGKLDTAPTRVPGQLQKTQNIAPHANGTPDIGVEVDKRTSVGVFGDMSRIEREDIRTSTVKQGRDVGAGVTLQYKFGTP